MRELATKQNILEFMQVLGRVARTNCRVYFTGGTTAVLLGWRETTVDIDLKFEPELNEIFRAIPELKERLHINVELASPSDFIPELPGWKERCKFIQSEGKVSFFNYDPYSQALAKIERNHAQDEYDVAAMFRDGSIHSEKLLDLFNAIEPQLYKYPALDPASFACAVKDVIEKFQK